MTEVRAKKALGQHFLTDLNIARKICDALSGGAIRLHPAAPGTGVSDAAFSETAAPGPAASEHAVPCAGATGANVPAADTAAEACDVLEVGCGMGVLTQFLLRRTDLVTWGAEIDAESVAYLHAHYPEFAPRLIEGDFLKMDLRARFPRGLRIIGNFPYNISSQIFFRFADSWSSMEIRMTPSGESRLRASSSLEKSMEHQSE